MCTLGELRIDKSAATKRENRSYLDRTNAGALLSLGLILWDLMAIE